MSLVAEKKIYIGSVHDSVHTWTPFQYEHPTAGTILAGEVTVFRAESSGDYNLLTGLWRGYRGGPGFEDGNFTVPYDAPLGDETVQVIDGEVTITNHETGDVHHFKAGDIFSIPKNTDTTWEFAGTYFKKHWVITHNEPLPEWFS